jgi:hypothetical protein
MSSSKGAITAEIAIMITGFFRYLGRLKCEAVGDLRQQRKTYSAGMKERDSHIIEQIECTLKLLR